MAKPESSPEEDVLPEAAADPKPAIVQVAATTTSDEPISIPKPTKSALDLFKSTRDPSIASVETLLTALPHYRIAEAKDWTRLHPNEVDYWSTELCFVNVPVKGQKRDTLHLIGEELANAIYRAIEFDDFAWRWRRSLLMFSFYARCRRRTR